MAEAAPSAARRTLKRARRVVLKIGSATLAHLDIDAFADAVERQKARGVDVIVVSSGAVAYGMASMGVTERPASLIRIQALAAVGQVSLMSLYQRAFARHGTPCAQVLLTHEALSHRHHFLNIRHTLGELLSMGVVPIANENDTVAIEELRFGDNDRLAAAIATVADADLIIILSDVDALYDAEPRTHSDANRLPEVKVIDDRIRAVAGGSGTDIGTGGMASKVQAAALAVEAGIPLVIVSGHDVYNIDRVLAGESVGTHFHANNQRVDRRRHWIGFLSKLCGRVTIDAGAVKALRERKSSLLPAGVTAVEGAFSRGDGVAIVGPDGVRVARGLVAYDAETVALIVGRRTDAVRRILGVTAVDPVVHRNDLVMARERA